MEALIMAKCVKMFEGPCKGDIVRVSDEDANRIVHTEVRGEFVSKKEWKESGRTPVRGGRI